MNNCYLGEELTEFTVDNVTVKPGNHISVLEKTGNFYHFKVEAIYNNNVFGNVAVISYGGYYGMEAERNKNYYSEGGGGLVILDEAKIVIYGK